MESFLNSRSGVRVPPGVLPPRWPTRLGACTIPPDNAPTAEGRFRRSYRVPTLVWALCWPRPRRARNPFERPSPGLEDSPQPLLHTSRLGLNRRRARVACRSRWRRKAAVAILPQA